VAGRSFAPSSGLDCTSSEATVATGRRLRGAVRAVQCHGQARRRRAENRRRSRARRGTGHRSTAPAQAGQLDVMGQRPSVSKIFRQQGYGEAERSICDPFPAGWTGRSWPENSTAPETRRVSIFWHKGSFMPNAGLNSAKDGQHRRSTRQGSMAVGLADQAALASKHAVARSSALGARRWSRLVNSTAARSRSFAARTGLRAES